MHNSSSSFYRYAKRYKYSGVAAPIRNRGGKKAVFGAGDCCRTTETYTAHSKLDGILAGLVEWSGTRPMSEIRSTG